MSGVSVTLMSQKLEITVQSPHSRVFTSCTTSGNSLRELQGVEEFADCRAMTVTFSCSSNTVVTANRQFN